MSKNGDSDRPIVQIWDENSRNLNFSILHCIVWFRVPTFGGNQQLSSPRLWMGWVWVVSRENRTIIALTYG